MKYMGSKNRFAKDIIPILIEHKGKAVYYIEPFVGGCNIIDKINGLQRIGNDSNEYLIEMIKCLRYGWTPPQISRDEYKKIRDSKNNFEPAIVGWTGLMCSYSGKWFGGYAGKTKTKTGNVRDYQQEALKNIKKQIENLYDVSFVCGSYLDLNIPPQSIVYCDPPYRGTTKYKDDFDHDIFWDWVRRKSQLNWVYVSEYEAPEDFECVWSKEASSSLSANGKIGGNKKSIERLFVYRQSMSHVNNPPPNK